MPVRECQHTMCFKGTHPSFPVGKWLCVECEQFIELDLIGYGVVLTAFRKRGKDEGC